MLTVIVMLTAGALLLSMRRYRHSMKKLQETLNNNKISEQETAAPPLLKEGEDLSMRELVSRFQELCRNDKIYLDQELTIQSAAKALSSNRTYLSRSINTILNISFTAYINSLRIEEAA